MGEADPFNAEDGDDPGYMSCFQNAKVSRVCSPRPYKQSRNRGFVFVRTYSSVLEHFRGQAGGLLGLGVAFQGFCLGMPGV